MLDRLQNQPVEPGIAGGTGKPVVAWRLKDMRGVRSFACDARCGRPSLQDSLGFLAWLGTRGPGHLEVLAQARDA